MLPEKEPEFRRKPQKAGTLVKVAALGVLGGLSAMGLVRADQEQVCEQQSEALAPFLEEIVESGELEGRTEPFTATDEDLSPELQQKLKEHFEKMRKQGTGCTIEIGQQDK